MGEIVDTTATSSLGVPFLFAAPPPMVHGGGAATAQDTLQRLEPQTPTDSPNIGVSVSETKARIKLQETCRRDRLDCTDCC